MFYGNQCRLECGGIEKNKNLNKRERRLLEKLEAQDKTKADLVKLRYFVGMTITEAAQALGISEPTAKRYWTFARAWLYAEMEGG
jgi:DNA-directed RNA polymerase specialized sigma24 family protein